MSFARVQLPGSAVAGWPAEVPLPIDPQWKRDYAASVRRLVIDGVDVPLADLFLHAAARFSPSAEGVAQGKDQGVVKKPDAVEPATPQV